MDEPRTKATVLVVICKDDGNLAATVVRTKTDEYGVELVLRFLSTYKRVEIKNDGGPIIVEIAQRVAIPTRQNNEFGTVERRGSPRDWSSGTCA